MNIVEQVADKFNFEVKKFPLNGPDNIKTPWYGLFRNDTWECIGNGSVTARYVPHTKDDVCALVEASKDIFDGDFEAKCNFKQGHYVTIQPTKDYRLSVFGENDNVFPRLIISAGYNGKPFRASIGYYRDLCRNLAMMNSVEKTTVSIRHTNHLRDKLDDLINTFSILKSGWSNLSDTIKHMESRQVNLVDFMDSVYGKPDENSKRSVTIHKNRTESIFKRVLSERMKSGRSSFSGNFNVSAWEAYNAVQGYVQHDSSRKGKVTDFDRIVLSMNDPSVLRAETLAIGLSL